MAGSLSDTNVVPMKSAKERNRDEMARMAQQLLAGVESGEVQEFYAVLLTGTDEAVEMLSGSEGPEDWWRAAGILGMGQQAATMIASGHSSEEEGDW